jgi:L-amino acid N-acyltransferase YncA
VIRPVNISDAQAIMEIYNHYVTDSAWTQEYEPIDLETQEERIKKIIALYPYLVYEDDGLVIGYAYAGEFRWKPGYRWTVETTIYLHNDHLEKKIGRELYSELLEACRQQGFHRAIGGLTLPNERSAYFHEMLGFKKVGHFTECAKKFGVWHDIGFWELEL